MTLPASGSISSTQLLAEMGRGGSIVLPAADVLWLAGRAAMPITWPNNFWSKTWGPQVVNHRRFGATSSPGSQFTIPASYGTSPSTIVIGNSLAIVCQYAESLDATAPASVLPSGWTHVTNNDVITTDDAHGARTGTFARILGAGEAGSTWTGMNGTAKNRCAAMVITYDKPISSFTLISHGISGSAGVPSAPFCGWDGIRNGSHLICGFAHSSAVLNDVNFGWSGGTQPSAGSLNHPGNKGDPSQTRLYYYNHANEVCPSVQVNMGDNGTFNVNAMTILRIV